MFERLTARQCVRFLLDCPLAALAEAYRESPSDFDAAQRALARETERQGAADALDALGGGEGEGKVSNE